MGMMDWKKLLAYISGSVDEELLLRNEYLVTENRILRDQIKGRLKLSDAERKTLAEIGKKLGKRVLQEMASLVKTETILAWEPITLTVGQVITFTAQATGTEPITFTWAFGDGQVTSGALVTHTYHQSNVYSLVLTATNLCGWQWVERGIHVLPMMVTHQIYLPLINQAHPSTPRGRVLAQN